MTTSSAAAAFTSGEPTTTTAAAAPDGGATGGVVPTGTPPANDGWYSGIQTPEVRTWAQAKGFKDPLAAVESAYNLEKLIGFDRAGRTVVLPKDDAPEAEKRAFFSKMGVPEKPEDYKLEALKDAPESLKTAVSSWMHKHGIPPSQANGIAAEFAAFSATENERTRTAMIAEGDAAFSALTAEWGAEADANLELGRRFAAQMLPEKVKLDNGAEVSRKEFLATLFERTGATGVLTKLFAQAGKGLGEHKMADDGIPGGFAMSAQQALAKIQALKSDPAWTKAYLNGDKDKMAEMQRLFQLANGVPAG